MESRMHLPLVWSMKKMWFLKPMIRSPVLLRKQAADSDLSWRSLLLSSPSSSTVFLPCSSTLIFFLPGSSCKIFSSISNLSIKISVTRCLFSSQILITPFKLKVYAWSMSIHKWLNVELHVQDSWNIMKMTNPLSLSESKILLFIFNTGCNHKCVFNNTLNFLW